MPSPYAFDPTKCNAATWTVIDGDVAAVDVIRFGEPAHTTPVRTVNPAPVRDHADA